MINDKQFNILVDFTTFSVYHVYIPYWLKVHSLIKAPRCGQLFYKNLLGISSFNPVISEAGVPGFQHHLWCIHDCGSFSI